MFNILYHLFFILLTFFILVKTIFYGIYEIKTLQNKTGGIAVICFSVIVVLFANISVFVIKQ